MHGCMAILYTLCVWSETKSLVSFKFKAIPGLLGVGFLGWFLLSILNMITTCLQGNNTYLEHFKVLYFFIV